MPLRRLAATMVAIPVLLMWAGAAWALDVNTATQAELESVKGIGTGLSQKMLDARARRPFADWGDLMHRVPGLRVATATRLSAAGLTVNGVVYGTAAPASTPDR